MRQSRPNKQYNEIKKLLDGLTSFIAHLNYKREG